MEKNELQIKTQEGLSIRDISKYFNCSYTSVRYWLKKYNLNTSGYKKNYNWNKENLILAIEKSNCKSDILRNLNISVKSGNFQTLEKYCKKYEIDIGNLKYINKNGFKEKSSNEQIFILNSTFSRKLVKARIIKYKLIDYKCKICHNTGEWMKEKLSLQLDHINGIDDDNRLTNLRFLCPNCHSQTKTFGSKNKNNILKNKNLI